ncbi:cysteine rich repeat-containing protein [Martelella endophytica]|uniref:cysteine rich repeat-containing protein n=1 Tax=Martelella endophytica TaxID=1486262 RepID=UPI00069633C6|nr:cysteine rich repeat-containing protein [Martelella endophytica]
MTFAKTFAFGVSFVLLTAGIVSAQQPDRQMLRALKNACKADIQATCGKVSPGDGSMQQCVQENFENFSKPCQDAILAARAERNP